MIALNLEPNEVNFILQVIGKLPAKSGRFSLLMKIKEQADAQAPKDAPPPGQ